MQDTAGSGKVKECGVAYGKVKEAFLCSILEITERKW